MKNQLLKRLLMMSLVAGLAFGITGCGANSGQGNSAEASSTDESDDEDDEVEGVIIEDDTDESYIVNEKFESAAALTDDKAGDLDATRKAYLLKENDGDEALTEEELTDYDQADDPQDYQLKTLKENYDELGKLFSKYGITVYDLTRPNYADSEELDFDVYSDENTRFDIYVYYEDEALTEIDISEY